MEPEDLQLIEKYIDGALDEKALVDFRARMETDTAFARAVRMEEDIIKGIELWGNRELKKQLQEIAKEETGGAKIKKINTSRRRILWAAAAVLGLAVVAKFALGNSKPSPEKLYAEYAVHEFDFTQLSGGGNNLTEIEQLLKSEKYAEAIPLLENYMSENSDAHEINLAYGVALLETKKYADAHTIFDLIKNEVPILKNDATWYNALTFLRENKLEECKRELNTIPENSARYGRAQKLMGDL